MGSRIAPLIGETTGPVRRCSAGYGGQAGWSQSTPLLAGDPGTSQTIDLIRKAVWQGLSDARVRAQLAQILQGVQAYDTPAELQAIYAWVHQNIRFTNDPVGHETVSTASWTIAHGIGDCDDINAVLIPTLVMSAGIPAHLVTVSNDPSDPSRFSHVYAEAEVNGRWIPIDAARPGASFGTTVRQYGRKRVWSLVDRQYQDLAGLNGVTLQRAGMGFSMAALSEIIAGAGRTASEIITAVRPRSQAPPPIAPGTYTPATFTPYTPYTPGQQPPPPAPAPPTAGISPLLLLGVLGIGVALIAGKK